MAYDAVLFVILALLEIGSAIAIYLIKDTLHAILALALVFLINSAMFLVLQQPLLALISLFVMVGGVATYVFVGVSSSGYSKFVHTDYRVLVILYAALFLLIGYKAVQSGPIAPVQNTLSPQLISQSLGPNIALLYMMALVLFGVGFGSIILMKKTSGKK